jgi:chromatin segregation and condensation protein Rec8/ScpA/Scc1 (kleisin family)
MPDTLARELIAGREQRKQLQRELNEIKEEREAAKKEAAKNKEYEDFLNEFPDVKASEIPKEVFEEAEKTSLSNAYMKWKMKEMETQISILKTNEKNKNSAVGGVTSTGPTNEKHEKDFFLEGFLE